MLFHRDTIVILYRYLWTYIDTMYNGETLKGSEKIPKKVVSDASRDAGEKFERRSGLFDDELGCTLHKKCMHYNEILTVHSHLHSYLDL